MATHSPKTDTSVLFMLIIVRGAAFTAARLRRFG
jgi:hypothetical protein